MKNQTLISIVLWATIALLGQACSENENAPLSKEKIQFSFTVSSAEVSGGRTDAATLPDNVDLRISLNTASGETVFTNHTITLLRMGDSYVSDVVELQPMRYVLTDFMLVKDSEEVMYATPKRGSPLASAVVHPLPYTFVVGRDKVSTIAMEVIDAQQSTPEDFGYVSFDVTVITPWRISVFALENDKLILTNAHAFLYRNATLEHEYELSAKVNSLQFDGDPADTYTLVVAKDGFASTYTQAFKYEDIIAAGNQPITVVLQEEVDEPAFVFEGQSDFFISYEESGSLVINWGDGSAEVANFVYSEEEGAQNVLFPYHEYENERKPVTITGDLHLIKKFGSVTIEGGGMTSINASALTALESLNLVRSNIDVLDLTNNSELTSLIFSDCIVGEVLLPSPHKISDVRVDTRGAFTFDESLLDDVYDNAIAENIMNGVFYLDTETAPSAEAIQKLNDLQNNYQWSIAYTEPPIE